MTQTFSSPAELLRHHVRQRPDEPVLHAGDRTLTWLDLYDLARRTASAMAGAGVGSQDRVAFIDKNTVEYFATLFGAALLNAVTVGVNWRLSPREMAYIVNDAEAKLLVLGDEFGHQLNEMAADLESAPMMVRSSELAAWVAPHPADDPGIQPEPDDVCLQLYTSGTTGLPKGAMLSNDNFSALLEAGWGMSADSVSLVAMPVFHIGGSGWALYSMAHGAELVLMRDLDPASLLQLVERHRISHAFLVPAALQFLLAVPADGIDLSSMEVIFYGASPITEPVLVGAMDLFGCDFVQLYGLTETSGAIVQLDPTDHDPGGPRAHLLRAAGQAMPGSELRIVDPATGEAAPDGQVGEVWIRGPQVMKGYWKLPEETAEAMPGDGWFRSGDAGYMQDGYLFIHDRVKDMIISGGENIYPAEVENALMSHPAIADIAVIGVPDQRWGETPKAVVVVAEGASLSEVELIDFARDNLAHFKCPTSVDFVASIPRNPSGKVLKRQLREPYWQNAERLV